ncbi:aminoacid/polyamine transporter [Legionella tucsonensis]|uniref:Aminoacid/polyamine transporter n=1 Tax=Legionella tucsonensis TaxID=40335 RepID=A0A0W0ZY84_9GAMM|nr:aminoacid/polyamine transporter [Legionella tucsonensis]
MDKVRKERKDNLIAFIIHELVELKWYEHLLYNIHATGLRALLLLLPFHGIYVKNEDLIDVAI